MERFFDFLEKLRAKPEPARRRILAGALLILMALVVIGWFKTSSLAPSAQKNSKTLPSSVSSPPPWEVIRSTFTAGWSDLKETIQKENNFNQ